MATNRLVDKRNPKRRRLDVQADVMSRPWPSRGTALATEPSFRQQDYEQKRPDVLTIHSRPLLNSVPSLVGFEACQTIAPASDVQQFLESRVFSPDYDPNQIQRLSPRDYRVYGRHMVASFIGVLRAINLGLGINVVILKDIGSDAELVVKMDNSRRENNIIQTLLRSGCALLRYQFVNIEGVEEADMLQNEYDGSPMFVETAHGSLNDYMSLLVRSFEFSFDSFPLHAVQICEVIRQQMVCLFDADNNFVCLNVTPSDILFKCNHKTERVHFFLRDLISPMSFDGETYLTKIPPPLHRYSIIFPKLDMNVQLRSVEEKEAALSWALGIFLLEMVSYVSYIEIHNLKRSFIPNDLDDDLGRDEDYYLDYLDYPLFEGNFKENYTNAYNSVLEFLYPRKHKQFMRSSLTGAKSGRQPYDDGIAELLAFDPRKRRSIRRPLI